MDYFSLVIQNQIIENEKTGEELFLHRNSDQSKVTVTVKRMAKKKRSDTITMQIPFFSAFTKDKNYKKRYSNPVQIGGYSWRIYAERYLPLIRALIRHETKLRFFNLKTKIDQKSRKTGIFLVYLDFLL